MQINTRLAMVVAAVSVAAVVAGSALAYRQSPKSFGAQAAPLAAPTSPSAQVSKTPTGTPSAPAPVVVPKTPPSATPSIAATPTPSATPSGQAGPVKVSVNLGKLGKGRDPQVPFLIGREVRGGSGWMRKIPGTDTIHQVARLGDDVLAVVQGFDFGLVKIDGSGKSRSTADVSSLVGNDGSAVAYAAVPADGTGGVVYSETAGSVRKLAVPAAARGLEVLRLGSNGSIYYHWKGAEAAPWRLFEWQPGAAAAKQLTTVNSPDQVSLDGAVAISTSDSSPGETTRLCSTVTTLATGKQLWRTCDSVLSGFTPDHSVVIGVGDRAEVGTAARITAQDTATGTVIREWTGAFDSVVAEDDQHLLIVAENATGGTRSAIIRCEINTGSCEAAVGLTSSQLILSGR
ncbi:hypothetical protein AB0P21_28825 [Kribbella sp. NPDC056861]|uniref:hypothetical protein n=1 Tax=Kribbella sp. NPDC056861 TaxID=3154857 RepID=UPI00344489A6